MEIQPVQTNNLSFPARFARWGLRGGALAALVALTFGVASNVSGSAVLAVLGIGAAGGGTLAALVALVFRRGRFALHYVESDLERARAMMERRLINEEEYMALKSRILARFDPGPTALPNLAMPLYWGAVLGMITCGLLAVSGTWDFTRIILVTGATGVVGGVVAGTAAQGYALASGMARRFQLPAPEDRRMLDE